VNEISGKFLNNVFIRLLSDIYGLRAVFKYKIELKNKKFIAKFQVHFSRFLKYVASHISMHNLYYIYNPNLNIADLKEYLKHELIKRYTPKILRAVVALVRAITALVRANTALRIFNVCDNKKN